MEISDAEVLAHESLAELPMGGRHVPRGGAAMVTGCDSKGQGLAEEEPVGLPVLPPVAAHGHPLGVGSFHAHPHDISCTRDVADQN